MASSNNLSGGKDETVGAIAVGFCIGFGFLTVWEAIKQTRRSRNPRRSPYIAMIWGELFANVLLLTLGFLFFKGVLTARCVRQCDSRPKLKLLQLTGPSQRPCFFLHSVCVGLSDPASNADYHQPDCQ